MNRLTDVDGSRTVVIGMNEKNQDKKLQECVEKLKQYEDTGVEPERINYMLDAYGDKCEEITSLKQRGSG